MKNMKKMFSLVLALVMMMALAVSAGAESAPQVPTTGSITITNAAKGETYKIFKLFDAKVVAGGVDENKGITYTYDGTTLPKSADDAEVAFDLNSYFEIIATGEGKGQVRMKNDATALSEDAVAALKAWAATQTASAANTKVADGGEVKFEGIALGYYVITSTVDSGAAISVNSTTPNVEIVDKNSFGTPTYPTDPTDPNKSLGKTADGVTYQVGETVTYTLRLKTVNWAGIGEKAKQVVSYTFKDTITATDTDGKPMENALSTRTITGVVIKNGKTENEEPKDVSLDKNDYAFDENGQITIKWVDDDGNSLYNNGAEIEVTYTATVLKSGTITNKLETTYKTKGTEGDEDNKVPTEPEVKVYSSNIVIDKFTGGNAETGEGGTVLAGAKFVLKNGNNEGAKYYKIEGNVVSWVDTYDVEADADKVVFTTDSNGATTFVGLEDGTYYLEEVEAPAGYNKLGSTKEVTVSAATDTNNAVSYTAHVQNQTGTELPSTGGIGTTIFTVTGGLLMIGAAILLLTKKRSEA